MAQDGSRRKSDASGASRPSEPAVQIRGFHVEGQSPEPCALLQEQLRAKVTSGSPVPVLIPPSFQVRAVMRAGPRSGGAHGRGHPHRHRRDQLTTPCTIHHV